MSIFSMAILIAAIGQSSAVVSAGDAGRIEEQKRLEACVAKIQEDPANAYEDGLAWVNEGGRPFARQCTALALVQLGHAAEGAVRLEDLANASDGGSLRQRVLYLTQAGNAWLLAGAPEAALITLNNALSLGPNDPGLHADRAAAYMELELWEQAEADLEFALQGLRRDQSVWKMRAEVRLNLGDLEGAEFDIGKAMALDGTDIPTLLLRGRLREAKRLQAEDNDTQPASPIILID